VTGVIKMSVRLAVVSFVVLATGAYAVAEDWPQFLGANRNGVSTETGLIAAFPKEGADILWRQPVGVGMSNVAVAGDLVYTLFQDAEQQYIIALNVETGKEKWKVAVAPAYENAMGNGPRATPTVHDETVFGFTGEGVLFAVGAKSGALKWKSNAPKELVCKPSEYGMASSPLVHGTKIIVQVGSHRGAVAAFDQASGRMVWAAGEGRAGYSSPMIATLAGREQIVAFIGEDVLGIDPVKGDVLWSYEYKTDYDCNTATPVALDGSTLLISAGENHGSTILKITNAADAFAAEAVWESHGDDSVLRAEWQTPVVFDGHLYALDNKGSAGPITNLVCIRLKDHEQVWSQPRFGKSNLTLADGKLFVSTMRGELVIVNATPEAFEELSRTIVLETTRQAPVIANGRLYLRDDKEVVCLDVRARAK